MSTTVITARSPASSYLLLNSADRYRGATYNGAVTKQEQPWNNFTLTRGSALLPAFAKRLTVSEIRFPWFIPNINSRNNRMYFGLSEIDPIRPTVLDLEVFDAMGGPTGLSFAPHEIVLALNSGLADLYKDKGSTSAPPFFTWNFRAATYSFSNPTNGDPLVSIHFPGDYNAYRSKPSLYKTLGFTFDQAIVTLAQGQDMTGAPVDNLYTRFVDICSHKLCQYTRSPDGSSNNATDVIARIYCADAINFPNDFMIAGATHNFTICKQFTHPKVLLWEPTAQIGEVDIQVRDEYGDLVPLPEYLPSTTALDLFETSYPDFQITLVASEE